MGMPILRTLPPAIGHSNFEIQTSWACLRLFSHRLSNASFSTQMTAILA